MAQNKNQHYVPRCHLKPFSLAGDGLAINLLSHNSQITVENAPLKNQCSRNYFYGSDLELEKVLQAEEGRYAAIVKRILGDQELSEANLKYLRSFAYLQASRTASALGRRKAAFLEMDAATCKGFENYKKDELDVSHEAVLHGMLRTWGATNKHVNDLDVVLVRNETDRDFITSDDPSVITNRVYLQRLKDQTFGLISFGTQLVMPITPRVALMCYDREAYLPKDEKKNWIVTRNRSDIDAINEFQHLNSVENLYFKKWADRDLIASQFAKLVERRPADRFRLWVGIQLEDENGFERYRKANEEELASTAPRVVSISPVYPVPTKWFAKLPYRQPLKALTNGSAVGYIRAGQAKDGVRYRSEKLPIGTDTFRNLDTREMIYRAKVESS